MKTGKREGSDRPAGPVLIALGGNLPGPGGGPEVTIRAAMEQIGREIGPVAAASPLYRTPCFPAGAGPDYVNAALRIDGGGDAGPSNPGASDPGASDPGAILARLHRIELRHGRARAERWGMRTLDLDLIAVGDLVLPDAATQARWRALPADLQRMRAPDALILPHPRVQDRAFVLVPLADVAAGWVHPVLGLSVAQMLAARPAEEVAGVVALAG